MQIRSLRTRPRAGWLPALGFAVVGVASACSSGDGNTNPTPSPSPTPGPVGAGSAEVTGVRALASGLIAPMDSTPDPEGNRVFFTAMAGPRSADSFDAAAAGVVMVTNKSGAAPSMLASGFTAPVQVIMSIDGDTTFVADPAAQFAGAMPQDEPMFGAVFSVPSAGGNKSEVAGTRGYRPRGLDVQLVDGDEWLYFVGVDPADGDAGVFRVKIAGGSVETIKKGEPFGSPQCLAVTKTGDVYVTDSGDRLREGSILKVVDGAVSVIAEQVRMATPAGVALSEDEKFLLVSAIRSEAQGGTAVVLRIDLATNTVGLFDDGISSNTNSAGLHRAHKADAFTWADSGGTVYLVGTKKNPLP